MHGAKTSLIVATSVAVVVSIVGVTLGVAVGYNRIADNIVMRIMDGMMSFPTLVLALALVAVLGSSLINVILVISIVDIPGMTRLVRGVVLSIRERPYVDAARMSGASLPRILAIHIAPNTLAPVIIQTSVLFAGAILTEAALGFLGVGTPEFIPSWGNIISVGGKNIQVGFWIALFPGIFLALTVLSANLVGDGLRGRVRPEIERVPLSASACTNLPDGIRMKLRTLNNAKHPAIYMAAAALVILTLALAACGGGGDGATGPTPTPRGLGKVITPTPLAMVIPASGTEIAPVSTPTPTPVVLPTSTPTPPPRTVDEEITGELVGQHLRRGVSTNQRTGPGAQFPQGGRVRRGQSGEVFPDTGRGDYR